jgi:hypothetical protein
MGNEVAHQTRSKKSQRAERIINDQFSETMLANIFDYTCSVVDQNPLRPFDDTWLTLCLVARRWRAAVAKNFFHRLPRYALELEKSSLINALYIQDAREATFWIALTNLHPSGMGLSECKFGMINLGKYLTHVMINKPTLRINNSTTLNAGLEKTLLTIPSKDIQRITLDSNETHIPPSIFSNDMWKHFGGDRAYGQGPSLWIDQSANWHDEMSIAEVDQWRDIFWTCSKMVVFVPTDDAGAVERCLHKRFALLIAGLDSFARYNLEVRAV